MQAIITKFLGPTNNRGSRYKATAAYSKKSVTVSADYSKGLDANHDRACLELCKVMGWHGKIVSAVGDGGEHIYVFTTYTSDPDMKPHDQEILEAK